MMIAGTMYTSYLRMSCTKIYTTFAKRYPMDDTTMLQSAELRML
jgi:hypothetical protein